MAMATAVEATLRPIVAASLLILGACDACDPSAPPQGTAARLVGALVQCAVVAESRAALGVLRLRPALLALLGSAWAAGAYDAGPALAAVACADQTGALCAQVSAACLAAARERPAHDTLRGLCACVRSYNAAGARAPDALFDRAAPALLAALLARPPAAPPAASLPPPLLPREADGQRSGQQQQQQWTQARAASVPVRRLLLGACAAGERDEGHCSTADAGALVLRMASPAYVRSVAQGVAAQLLPHLRACAPEQWRRAAHLVAAAGILLECLLCCEGPAALEPSPGILSSAGELAPALLDLACRCVGRCTLTRSALRLAHLACERSEAAARAVALLAPRAAQALLALLLRPEGPLGRRASGSSAREMAVQLAAVDRVPAVGYALQRELEALLAARVALYDARGATAACQLLCWLLDSSGTFLRVPPPPGAGAAGAGCRRKGRGEEALFATNPAAEQPAAGLQRTTVQAACQMLGTKPPRASEEPWWLVLAQHAVRAGAEEAALVAEAYAARWPEIRAAAEEAAPHASGASYLAATEAIVAVAAACANTNRAPTAPRATVAEMAGYAEAARKQRRLQRQGSGSGSGYACEHMGGQAGSTGSQHSLASRAKPLQQHRRQRSLLP
eukprot:m51a1_g8572 hypothetical protein (624) ;mRNA; r:199888-202076